jgi:hypothetical protein
MDNQVPGAVTNAAKKTDGRAYKRQDFPKAVYGKSLKDCKIIKCEEERPDGYADRKDWKEPSAKADHKRDEAKKAERALRRGIMAYLDEHDVDYAKNISTSKLEELKVALDTHLEKQEPSDDAE